MSPSDRALTTVVTGSNTGIGKATARLLAERGFKVIMACRDVAKAEAARNDLLATGLPPARLVTRALDLGSFDSIRAFAKELAAEQGSLDVLVNNAGVWMQQRSLTKDGFEQTYGINHLGTFLLTRELLPLLRSAPEGRIVTVSSELHRRGDRSRLLDDPNAERGSFNGTARYSDSKLANVLFTHALAKRLAAEGAPITANALHPGVIATDLARGFNAVARWFVKLLFKSPEQGAATSVYLASSPDVAKVSGKFFEDCKERAPSGASLDQAAAERLWTASEAATGVARWA